MDKYEMPYRPYVGETVQFWTDPTQSRERPDGSLMVTNVSNETISGWSFSKRGYSSRTSVRHYDDPVWKDPERRQALLGSGGSGAFLPHPATKAVHEAAAKYEDAIERINALEAKVNGLARAVGSSGKKKEAVTA